MIHLQFQATSNEEPADHTKILAKGCSALQALAMLEANVAHHFNADDENRISRLAGFSRDLDLDAIEIAEPGDTFDFGDFSCPEENFTITVLPPDAIDATAWLYGIVALDESPGVEAFYHSGTFEDWDRPAIPVEAMRNWLTRPGEHRDFFEITATGSLRFATLSGDHFIEPGEFILQGTKQPLACFHIDRPHPLIRWSKLDEGDRRFTNPSRFNR